MTVHPNQLGMQLGQPNGPIVAGGTDGRLYAGGTPGFSFTGPNPAVSPTDNPAVQSGIGSVVVPQTGLIGSEQALNAGANLGRQDIIGGTAQAQQYLQNMIGQLGGRNPSSGGGAVNVNISGGGGFRGSTDIGSAVKGIGQQVDQGRDNINAAFTGAETALAGYNQGEGAAKLRADLSGANGPEAEAAAQAQMQSSPYAAQMLENAERGIMRNASALGGLRSGNTMDQLYQNAAGMFAQDQQNRFNNLGTVSDAGQAAASQIAGNKTQQAGIEAGLTGQMAGIEAGLIGQQMSIEGNLAAAQLSGQFGLAQASMVQQAQRDAANLAAKTNLTSQLADLAYNAGIQTAGLGTQTAAQLAQGRTNAGNAIAQNATQAASSISQLLNQQGIVVSDMMSRDISSISDMIYQSGMQSRVDNQQLAAILANIAGGQASNALQGYQQLGLTQAAGTIGVGNAVQGGIETYLGTRK